LSSSLIAQPIRLVDVPWDLALEVILQSQSLGMVRIGNVIQKRKGKPISFKKGTGKNGGP
jgi:hypothetical protein